MGGLNQKKFYTDLSHNGGGFTYSFICMLISISGLVSVCKIQGHFSSSITEVTLCTVSEGKTSITTKNLNKHQLQVNS